jgi:hypothetical protein
VRERKARDKTHLSGKTPSDLRRIADVKRKQAEAARGRGRGADLNRDVVVPSVKRSVESGIKSQHAARGALGQLGELFGLQNLRETAKKVKQFAERAGIPRDRLGGASGGRSGERPSIASPERRVPIRAGGGQGWRDWRMSVRPMPQGRWDRVLWAFEQLAKARARRGGHL